MLRKTNYKTKQMSQLLALLEENKGKHLTVNDICEAFNKQGIPVGTATIYRRLEKFVAEGIVAKYNIDGTSSACFEYIGGDDCHKGLCIHCKCEACGKITHLNCPELKMIDRHLLEEHGFKADAAHTVIYGICDSCRKAAL